MAPLCTSSQVNLLVYHYLKESGFQHACFSLRHEGRLDEDPLSKEAVIAPGQLVRILQKGLLYMAVEAHINADGTEKPCSAPFKLVGPPHSCDGKARSPTTAPSPPPRLTPTPPPEPKADRIEVGAQTNPAPAVNGLPDRSSKEASSSQTKLPDAEAEPAATAEASASSKRKAAARTSGASSTGREEKRARREGTAESSRAAEEAGTNGRAGETEDEDEEASAAHAAPPTTTTAGGRGKKKKGGASRKKENSAAPSKSAKASAPANIPPLSAKMKDKEVASDKLIRLRGHNGEVLTSAWNPTVPGLLASGAGDATVRIWDLSSARFGESNGEDSGPLPPGVPPPAVCKYLPATHAKDISALDWNPDGTLLASGSFDGILRLWTPQGDLHLVMSMHQGPIFTVRWNRKGNLVLTGSADGTAIVWDLSSGKVRQQFSLHSDSVLDIDWLVGARWSAAAIGAAPGAAPSGLADNTLATCSADNSVNILRIGESKPIRSLKGHTDEVNGIRFDPTGTLLASVSDDMTCRIWSVDNVLGHGFAGAGGVSASSDLRPRSSSADMDVDEEDGSESKRGGSAVPSHKQSMTKHVLRGHTKELYSVAWAPFSPNTGSGARLLATSSFDKTARLWNAEDGSCLRVFSEHTNNVYSLCFSPDARFLATGGTDHRVFVQRLADGKVLKAYAGAGPVMDIVWQCHPLPAMLRGGDSSSASALKASHKRASSTALTSSSAGATNGNGRASRAKSHDVANAGDEDDGEGGQGEGRVAYQISVASSDKVLTIMDLRDLLDDDGVQEHVAEGQEPAEARETSESAKAAEAAKDAEATAKEAEQKEGDSGTKTEEGAEGQTQPKTEE